MGGGIIRCPIITNDQGQEVRHQKMRGTTRATQTPAAPRADPKREQTAEPDHHRKRRNRRQPVRVGLVIRVTVRTHKAATVEEHPSRFTSRCGIPAMTQTYEIVPVHLRLVGGFILCLSRMQS